MKTTKKPKSNSTATAPKAELPKTTAKAAPKTTLVARTEALAQEEAPNPTERHNNNHVILELVKPGAKSVCVAGSFNQWKPEETPLVQKGNDRWVGDLTVRPGRHEYLFVVDGQWLPDPNAKETVANPFGGMNSVLIVSE